MWAVLAGLERFGVEFLRAKDDRIGNLTTGLSMAQVIAMGMMLFGLVWMRLRRDVTAEHPGIHAG
jgi:prolipoprotein diacylglyceryltransferase